MWLWIIAGIYALGAVAILAFGLWEWRTTHHGIQPGESLLIAVLWPLFFVMALIDGF